MRALLGQISPVIGDVRGNLNRCLSAVAHAREKGCQLVLLPELVLSGYPPRDLLERSALARACRVAAEELAAASLGGPIIVFGTPWQDDRGLRSSAVVAHEGRIHDVVHKSRLPTYDVFDESRWFVPETEPRVVRVGDITLGITICEDIWDAPELFAGHRYTTDPTAALQGTNKSDTYTSLSAPLAS